jgi:signal transduction histidine kinase
MLSDFMSEHRDTMLALATKRLRKLREAPPAVERTRENNVSLLFDSVLSALRAHEAEGSGSAPRVADGAHISGEQVDFDIDELVFQYESLCHSVNEAAKEHGVMIPLASQQSLNTALDDCIARTVIEWEREKHKSRGTNEVQRLRFVANELGGALQSAVLSVQALRSGRIPPQGTTADVIERSHARLGALIDNLVTQVSVAERLHEKRARVPLRKLVDEGLARIAADARAKEIGISVEADRALEIEGVHDLLVMAVTNLLQNAVEFTRPGGSVSVRAKANTQGLVVIEIEDDRDGAGAHAGERQPTASADTDSDSSGVGLGLLIAQQVVEGHGGAMEVKDLPGRGRVFVVEMPSPHLVGELRV